MQDSKRLIIFVIIGLIVIAAFLAAVLIVKKNNTAKPNLSGEQANRSAQPIKISPSPLPTPITTFKTYQGSNFSLKYPVNWGLLTCSNSASFEFDPIQAIDQKIVCDRAAKPITVLVLNRLSCQGETTKIGKYMTVQSKTANEGGDINYEWCVNLGNGTNLDITHRVSESTASASSRQDFSSQIKQMIFDLQTNLSPS